MGAEVVFATDIDLLPRKIARENVAANRLEAVVHILEMDAFDTQAQDCDLVVANIVANIVAPEKAFIAIAKPREALPLTRYNCQP